MIDPISPVVNQPSAAPLDAVVLQRSHDLAGMQRDQFFAGIERVVAVPVHDPVHRLSERGIASGESGFQAEVSPAVPVPVVVEPIEIGLKHAGDRTELIMMIHDFGILKPQDFVPIEHAVGVAIHAIHTVVEAAVVVFIHPVHGFPVGPPERGMKHIRARIEHSDADALARQRRGGR